MTSVSNFQLLIFWLETTIAPFNLVIHAVQRRTLKHDQPRRARPRTSRERNRKYTFGNPRAIVRHVKLPLDPNCRPIILRVEREPQAIIERDRVAHMRAERSEEGARRPSAFVLFVILRGIWARD